MTQINSPLKNISSQTSIKFAFLFILLIIVIFYTSHNSWISTKISPETTLRAEFLGCIDHNFEGAVLRCIDEKRDEWARLFGENRLIEQLTFYEKELGADFTCHLIGHLLGEIIYKNSPDLPTALATTNSSCFSSSVHGVIGQFTAEEGVDALLSIDLNDSCASVAEGYGAYLLCLHGLGHAFMLGTNYETTAALSMCDQLDVLSYEYDQCYSGVFMELFGAAVGRSHVVIPEEKYRREGDIFFPCTLPEIDSNKGYARNCYVQRMPALIDYANTQQELSIFDICQTAHPKWITTCTFGIGFTETSVHSVRSDQVIRSCRNAPTSILKNYCLAGAHTYIQFDDNSEPLLKEFCGKLSPKERSTACNQRLNVFSP